MRDWQHDHSECKTPTIPHKVYGTKRVRYTIHDFKSGRYVEAVVGTEAQAEARCVELRRSWGGEQNFTYKPSV